VVSVDRSGLPSAGNCVHYAGRGHRRGGAAHRGCAGFRAARVDAVPVRALRHGSRSASGLAFIFEPRRLGMLGRLPLELIPERIRIVRIARRLVSVWFSHCMMITKSVDAAHLAAGPYRMPPASSRLCARIGVLRARAGIQPDDPARRRHGTDVFGARGRSRFGAAAGGCRRQRERRRRVGRPRSTSSSLAGAPTCTCAHAPWDRKTFGNLEPMTERRLGDVGGTPGGLGSFIMGLIMSCMGGYLLTNHVMVTSSYWISTARTASAFHFSRFCSESQCCSGTGAA
jgi:hypothetical protein